MRLTQNRQDKWLRDLDKAARLVMKTYGEAATIALTAKGSQQQRAQALSKQIRNLAQNHAEVGRAAKTALFIEGEDEV